MGLSDVMVFTVRIKIVNSFPTNYPCNEAVRYKGNRFVVVLDNLLTSTIVIRQIQLYKVCSATLVRAVPL